MQGFTIPGGPNGPLRETLGQTDWGTFRITIEHPDRRGRSWSVYWEQRYPPTQKQLRKARQYLKRWLSSDH